MLAAFGETTPASVAAAVLAAGMLLRLVASTRLAALDVYARLDALGGAPALLTAACTAAVMVVTGISFSPVVFATATVLAATAAQLVHMFASRQRPNPYRTGEVIWATVQFNGRDSTGARSKQRPVLVMRDTGMGVDALYMTSRGDRYDGRDGWLRITGSWDRKGRPSWVDVTRRLTVPDRRIAQREAVLEPRQLTGVLTAARKRATVQERR